MAKDRTSYQPENTDWMYPTGFRLTLEKTPDLIFFSNAVDLPGIQTQAIPVNTRHTAMHVPGDTLVFDQLTMNFIVDEDMRNWEEIQTWLYALTSARDFQDYRNLKKEKPDGEMQDIHLTILTNKNNSNIRIKFENAFPISLSPIQFRTGESDQNPIEATVVFGFTTYVVERV